VKSEKPQGISKKKKTAERGARKDSAPQGKKERDRGKASAFTPKKGARTGQLGKGDSSQHKDKEKLRFREKGKGPTTLLRGEKKGTWPTREGRRTAMLL